MSSGLVVTILILAGVMAAIFVAVLFVTRRVGAGAEARADDLRDEVERLGETWAIPLQGASYGGATHTYSRAKGNGVAGLTGRRVVFEPIAGERLSIPLVRISGARLGRGSQKAADGRRRRLVLELDDGNEVGLSVAEPELWMRSLADAGVHVAEPAAG